MGMTDAKLLKLFRQLGPKYLILLEDVDCAGLGRKLRKVGGDSAISRATTGNPDTWTAGAPITENGVAQEQKPEPEPPARITLSGLLNTIDGVSAPEGHVLIMTTNHPELLDPALIRPGRCDVKVEFDYASKKQIRGIFLKVYAQRRSDRPIQVRS